ncbi:hypothetical protein GCWU000325_01592 [Alloprevotella tannerae ATCC 51259]|uniref:Uncharacterized protein n=1 Tax=Alloprevotella tannerae ATCC 51259 TaxID=626522 RepID=C9LH91_9BACT|nr:hypothetical protein GCWU000325_01592 [Alloprevotella tannerae ATCC 51259]
MGASASESLVYRHLNLHKKRLIIKSITNKSKKTPFTLVIKKVYARDEKGLRS